MSSALLIGYRSRAVRALRDPRSVTRLLAEADQLVRQPDHLGSRLADVRDTAAILIEMVQARLAGRYQRLSTRSVALIAAGLIYFVVPSDSIPDVLPVVGLLDDVTVLGWVGSAVAREIEHYKAWRHSGA